MKYKYDVTFQREINSGVYVNTECVEVIAITETQALASALGASLQRRNKHDRIVKIELVSIRDNMGVVYYRRDN